MIVYEEDTLRTVDIKAETSIWVRKIDRFRLTPNNSIFRNGEIDVICLSAAVQGKELLGLERSNHHVHTAVTVWHLNFCP